MYLTFELLSLKLTKVYYLINTCVGKKIINDLIIIKNTKYLGMLEPKKELAA